MFLYLPTSMLCQVPSVFQGRWIGEKHYLFIKSPTTKENHAFL